MSILTVAQFRTQLTTTLVDAAIQQLLDAAEAEIIARRGVLTPRTELRKGGLLLMSVSRVVASISAVVEGDGVTTTTLDSTDWNALPDGTHIRRLASGTHPADRWCDVVGITYTPADDTAERVRVQVALVKLDIAYSAYGASSTAAEARSSVGRYHDERQAILDSFALPGVIR